MSEPLHGEYKVPGGKLVAVDLAVAEERISQVHVHGDFFLDPDEALDVINAALLGAPSGFTVTVRNLKVSAGAGFIVALTGDIMTMPGLPKSPAAERIDVDENGKISGLF